MYNKLNITKIIYFVIELNNIELLHKELYIKLKHNKISNKILLILIFE